MTQFTHPALPYAIDALAPHMSAETLEYHHGKHHLAYVNKANELIVGTGLEGKSDEEIIKASFADKNLTGLFNNAAQYWNHKEFWEMMTPNGGGASLPTSLTKAVTESFGSFDEFRKQFVAGGMGQFGSGWVWLTADNNGKLGILKTPNGENPIVNNLHTLLGCDVWEHSYYIDYRNARQKYLESFVDNLVNWDYVESLYAKL